MNGKIRILFHNMDAAGVNYYRTLTPAMELERNHSDEFYVEINPKLDFNDPNIVDYLRSFHIIHYHRQLLENTSQMLNLKTELNKTGTVFIVDIDDYWYLHDKHPYYQLSIENKLHIPIIENLKIADYITTTTELFANEIRKVTGKNNVMVFPNSIDPVWMKQFQNNWKPSEDGRVRISYMAGSSHLADVQQLKTVFNVLNADHELKDKFKIILAGWDAEGNTTEVNFNQEFGAELQTKGLLNNEMVRQINNSKGDVDKIRLLPTELKEKYRDNVFLLKQRDIKSEESVYYQYERILTDDYKIINNLDYYDWLMNFERNIKYENEGIFGRRWTEKANTYAKVLDESDIVIAPLADNKFNTMKSNLKQVECWSRKLPIVCSDIAPYNVDGRHMENCVLIPLEKNSHKYWKKYLKKLILDGDLRKKIGEQLYVDFKEKYNLEKVTKDRVNFYKLSIQKTLE